MRGALLLDIVNNLYYLEDICLEAIYRQMEADKFPYQGNRRGSMKYPHYRDYHEILEDRAWDISASKANEGTRKAVKRTLSCMCFPVSILYWRLQVADIMNRVSSN